MLFSSIALPLLLALPAQGQVHNRSAIRVPQPPAPSGDVDISFMTYNVQGPGWNETRRIQVVGAIQDDQPDVLGLHEARLQGAGGDLLLDLQADYEPYFTNTSGPIYLRRAVAFVVISSGTEVLEACSIGQDVDLNWMHAATPSGAEVVFYSAHFCVSMTPAGTGDPQGNQAQAMASVEFMNTNTPAGRVHVLVGDLNANQTSPTILYLTEGAPLDLNGQMFVSPISLDDTWAVAPANLGLPRPGTTASGGGTALDWILGSSSAEVVEAEVITFDIPAGGASGFSDHLPVTATLRVPIGLLHTGGSTSTGRSLPGASFGVAFQLVMALTPLGWLHRGPESNH